MTWRPCPRVRWSTSRDSFFYPLSTILVSDLLGIQDEDRDAVLNGAVANAKTTNTAAESEAILHNGSPRLDDLVEAKK